MQSIFKNTVLLNLFLTFLAYPAIASQNNDPQCFEQTIEKSTVSMCLQTNGSFSHDVYFLKVDKVLIFALVDDYAENVKLEHTVPEGLTIEFPLSKQGEKIVKIWGGCVPESKNDIEVARICNFWWGKYQIVNNIRFEFK